MTMTITIDGGNKAANDLLLYLLKYHLRPFVSSIITTECKEPEKISGFSYNELTDTQIEIKIKE